MQQTVIPQIMVHMVLMQSSSSYFQAGNMLVWTSTNWFPEDIRVFCFNKLLWRIQIWEVYLQALM